MINLASKECMHLSQYADTNEESFCRTNVSYGPIFRRGVPDLRPGGDRVRGAGPGGPTRPSHLRLPQDDQGM